MYCKLNFIFKKLLLLKRNDLKRLESVKGMKSLLLLETNRFFICKEKLKSNAAASFTENQSLKCQKICFIEFKISN